MATLILTAVIYLSTAQMKADSHFAVDMLFSLPEASQHEMRCARRALANGRPNETVLVCDVK